MILKRFLTVVTIILVFSANMFANNQKSNLTELGKEFLHMMIPQVMYVNAGITLQRKTIEMHQNYFIKTGILTEDDASVISNIASMYDYKPMELNKLKSKEEILDYFDGLLLRVDIIPEKMIIAQAIIESGWGKSKSSRACNNYFGLTCRGCGGYVVTQSSSSTYYLKKYDNLYECIGDFARILNTKGAYEDFRELRAEMRKKEIPLNSQKLAHGLMNYSELGMRYINKVKFVIHKYLKHDLLYYMHLS